MKQKLKGVLIAGGAGFIGSHLVDVYINKGAKVFVLDDLSSGSLNNLSHLKGNENFYFIHQDITTLYAERFKHYDFELVINLACPASPKNYTKDPIKTMHTCSVGMQNLLDLAIIKDCPILQVSTSEVYGDPKVHPQVESYNGNVDLRTPRSVYDEGKRYAEVLCYEHAYEYDLAVDVVRLFNTYGPRMAINDGRALPSFLNSLFLDEPITIYGDGSQTRSFCYVSDTVDAIQKIAGLGLVDPINIGNPFEIDILSFAKNVVHMWYDNEDPDTSHPMSFLKLPKADPKIRQPDISKVKNEIDWEPRVQLTEGLRRTIKHYKEEMNRG